MGVREIIDSPGEMLTAKQIGAVTGCNPNTIRQLAKMGELPFSSLWIGNTVKFPKRAFLKWMGVEG
jgi:excisionase family DNA binding protein